MRRAPLVLIPVLAVACGAGEGDGGDAGGAAGADAALVECGEPDEIVTLPYAADRLAGCTAFRGGIHVPDAGDPSALDPLRDIVRIDGRLTFFRNHALADLRGLERLERVGGLFSIRIDDSDGRFTTVDGLDRLREVGALEIESNRWLTSLAGFARLEVVHGDARIADNAALPPSEVDAFLARVRVEGTVDLGSGP